MPQRLVLPRLEVKPKRVVVASTFRIIPSDLSQDDIRDAIKAIKARVVQGLELHPWCYRKGVDETSDGVLSRSGIMHLHLGNPPGEQLLWVIQYEGAVVFLEVSGHRTFYDRPPGAALAKFHETFLNNWESAEDERIKKTNAMLRQAILNRK